MDIQIHIFAKIFNNNRTAFWLLRVLTCSLAVQPVFRGKNQLSWKWNERGWPSESNRNKTSQSMAFLVGRAHYASAAINVSIQNSEGKLCPGLSCPCPPAHTSPSPPVSLLRPLLDWNSSHKPTELWTGKKITPFHSRGNTQICVFRTTILFLCLIKLHSEHSIIKTRPEFMNKWSIYYIGQRKDKLYAWKVSLSCDSHKPMCWRGGNFFSSPQQLNQNFKISIYLGASFPWKLITSWKLFWLKKEKH